MAYKKDEIELIFSKILLKIEMGASLRSVLKEDGMPDAVTFYRWLDKDVEKVKQYARATELRADAKFDSIEQDYQEEPQRDPETGRIDSAWVQLQRLKIDSKKWELSKLNPKKYGDKVSLDHTTGGEKINQIDLSKYSDEELKLIAELQRKGGTG